MVAYGAEDLAGPFGPAFALDGPPTANPPARRAMPPTRLAPSHRLGLGRALGALVLLLLLGMNAAPTEAAGDAKPAPKFAELVKAWQAGSSEGVARCMEVKQAVSFRLLAYPLSGKARSMRPAQARATLKAYFKRLSSIGLKDVTPKRSPASVRIYEYTYRPAGKNTQKTRLQVQLKQDRNQTWVLASVTESP